MLGSGILRLLTLITAFAVGVWSGAVHVATAVETVGAAEREGDSALGLPWGVAGPAVVWRRSIGEGFSGFAVDGARAYTQVQDGAGQYVVCIEIATGKELWRRR